MAPPQENEAGSIASYRGSPIFQNSEPKRMRVSQSGGGGSGRSSSNSSKFTRAATGAPALMTNKGSVYKAQRGKAVTAAMVKAKAPTTHRRRGRKGKSVYRGVCVTREGKWRAVIYKERKQLYLGVYESEVDAAKAHDRAARFHFAENAVCNFNNEHEADRQAVLHKQHQLVQQHQVAEERAHQIALHGGGFVAGREEFDDLEEYHRGLEMEGASCSEEGDGEGDGDADGDADGDGDAEGEEEMSAFEETRSSRSFSTSSATSLSTGSLMSAEDAANANRNGNENTPQEQHAEPMGGGSGGGYAQHGVYQQTQSYYNGHPVSGGVAAAAAVGGAGTMGAGLHYDGSVNVNQQHHRGISSGSAGDSDSDFTPVSAFLQDAEPTPLEGMGFPYAEDLLGYEMPSRYNWQDNDFSPTTGGGACGFTGTPVMGQQHQLAAEQRRMGGVAWGFAEFGHPIRQSSSSSMASSASGFSTSDEDYVPSALPPLMGMCADP